MRFLVDLSPVHKTHVLIRFLMVPIFWFEVSEFSMGCGRRRFRGLSRPVHFAHDYATLYIFTSAEYLQRKDAGSEKKLSVRRQSICSCVCC